jgi:hypothetical protein
LIRTSAWAPFSVTATSTVWRWLLLRAASRVVGLL